MAFPQIAGSAVSRMGRVSGGGIGEGTTLTHNLPASIAAGDLLIFILHLHTPTYSSGLTGFTQVSTQFTNPTRQYVFYKIASGSEGATINVTQSAFGTQGSICLRITGHDVATAPVAAAAGTTDANPNPPNLDPATWGTEDTLWLAAYSWDRPDLVAFSSADGNYAHVATQNGTTSGGVFTVKTGRVYKRELAAASENPATFPLTGSEQWAAHTIAIRPAAAPAGRAFTPQWID